MAAHDPTIYEAFRVEDPEDDWALEADDWTVEAIDFAHEGMIYVAIFTGSRAEERAKEYCAWKNCGSSESHINATP